MTLVVIPDECQSIPITAPNDWNQNGCASRLQQLVAAVVEDDRLGHDGAEPRHAVGEPLRHPAAVQRQIGVARPPRHSRKPRDNVPECSNTNRRAAARFAPRYLRCGARRRRRLRRGEAGAVDADVLADALDVIARLVERDALDPIDRIGLAGARVAIGGDPLRDAAGAGVVGGERERHRAALVGDHLAEERRAELGVVGRVGDEPRGVEGTPARRAASCAVDGRICISPLAPMPEAAWRANSLSCRATA